jgi:hypothetical protein
MRPIDIYATFRDMDRDDIILSFKGDITKDLLSSVFQIMETRIEHENDDQRRKKKFYSVLVECLQNMYHHMEALQEVHADGATEFSGSGIFMIGRSGEGYRILTGNHIQTGKTVRLREKIDHINSLTPAELKAYYLEALSSTDYSEKGGAGLGIIEIARKSGNPIEYQFRDITPDYSFFTLSVIVN